MRPCEHWETEVEGAGCMQMKGGRRVWCVQAKKTKAWYVCVWGGGEKLDFACGRPAGKLTNGNRATVGYCSQS